jgi:hypothetical protein
LMTMDYRSFNSSKYFSFRCETLAWKSHFQTMNLSFHDLYTGIFKFTGQFFDRQSTRNDAAC